MLDRLNARAERIGVMAAERAKQRILAGLDEPGVNATGTEGGIVLSGRRLGERQRWIGGLFR